MASKALSATDIFNRPPAVSEDTLQYVLYPPFGLADRASVTTLATLIREYTETLFSGHIWHKDPFELKVVESADAGGWALEGRMRVGDAVDDEWCVAWLLREISAKWDVIISVWDSDGEFLLIEAADVLPIWINPSNAENRVWIYQSHLHLVPLSHVSTPSSKSRTRRYPTAEEDEDASAVLKATEKEYLNVKDALQVVRDPAIDTLAPEQVEKLVWTRISGYPAKVHHHVHTTNVYIPSDIAKALSANPSLIQKPIETFYTRDTLQLRAAHRMSRFPPHTSVLATVKMTRTAYAQLMGQKFYSPKIFGRWQEREGTPEWRWRDIGMKIACGFEMLYQESKSRSEATSLCPDAIESSLEARKEALRRQPDYQKYIENLASSGYFKGEREGSRLWSSSEDKAAAAYIEVRQEDDASRTSFATAVNNALVQVEDVLPSAQQDEDPDDWLNVDAADFDTMLKKSMGNRSKPDRGGADAMDVDKVETEENRVAKEQATRLQDLAKKVEQFVDGEGDVEGARFADEQLSDDEFSDDANEDSDERDSDEEMRSPEDDISKAERQTAMDKLVPAIEPSEYGIMPPSYHSNSQRVAPTTMEHGIREDMSKVAAQSSAESRMRPIRAPILPRDRYEGADSDDETDEEDTGDEEEEEEEEDMPQVVGEVEVDMEEEQDEFLEFARQALGMSNEQWSDIVQERKDRGAFVPVHVKVENNFGQGKFDKVSATTPSQRSSGEARDLPQSVETPNLDSFEAVMQAMDKELGLSYERKQSGPATATHEGKPKATADTDIEAAMDAELKASLESDQDEDGDGEEGDQSIDYNLIKNFLESFKSQGGLSGPASNLAGRLQSGWMLPRDETE